MQTTLKQQATFSDPILAHKLFDSTLFSWLWLVIRLYLGYTWLSSGIGKLSNPAWVQTGAALQGFWKNAVAIPAAPAKAPIVFDWYRMFLSALLDSGSYVWFSKVIVAGEILIGLGLILGIFTGLAAFFGGFMNWNFMMAGTLSLSPIMFPLSIALILAWKTAGWYGGDRWVLPLLGTPWQPGTAFKKPEKTASA